MKWSVIIEKAIKDDGSLFFPERLTQQFLDNAKKTMGSYIYANQYQNEVIPEGQQCFQKHWIKYYSELPTQKNTFIFIDPAISQSEHSDYTGICVVSVDIDQNWYVRHASRQKLNPTQIINLCFKAFDQFQPNYIGIEDVAFQSSLVHFAFEEMKRRNKTIPLGGVKRGTDKTKEMRILSLVPRFEWGTILLAQGLYDLELELSQFPRSSHDDLLDSLSSIEQIAYYPNKPRRQNEPPNPNSPEYESWYINQLIRKSNRGE